MYSKITISACLRVSHDHGKLVDAIIAGIPADQVKDKMQTLTERREVLEAQLAHTPAPDPIRIHPKIVLTPNSERTELIVDLCGDLAGILEMSESRMTGQARKTKEQLGTKERKELEQVEQIVSSAEIVAGRGFAPSKVKMVAGARSPLGLPSSGVGKDYLVAGVGFEPTTFRL